MIYIDFETYSEADITACGAYKYSVHPSTEILCMAFAIDDQPVELWTPDNGCNLSQLFSLINSGSLVEAHNAFFERCIWQNVAVRLYGFPQVQHKQWRCSAARVAAVALPRSLEDAAKIFECKNQKDMEGHRVMMKLSRPSKITKTMVEEIEKEIDSIYKKYEDKETLLRFINTLNINITHNDLLSDEDFNMIQTYREYINKYEFKFVFIPNKKGKLEIEEVPTSEQLIKLPNIGKYKSDYDKLYAYCKQDVETEREIASKTRPLLDTEQELWFLDQEINERGILMDKEAVEIAFEMGCDYTADALNRVVELTGGAVNSYKQVAACVSWAKTQGYHLEAFNKDYIANIADDAAMPDNVRELIQIRQQAAKTSTAKYEKMLGCMADDNRIRDNYMYHGASTGRWSGRTVQFQNLPRGKIKDMDTAIEMLKLGDRKLIEACYGMGAMDFLSSALRGMIIAPEGKQLYVADYAAIEARGVAWISGQEDLLDDFRRGEKVYEKQAASVYGRKPEEIGKESVERFVGKELVLACGYGMGAKKFKIRCDAKKVFLDDSFCEGAVKSWRKKNHMIVNEWYEQENAAILAVRTGKPITEGKVTWFMHGKFLYCKLPSRRCLAYYMPVLKEGETSWGERKIQLHVTGEKQVDTKKIWCEFSIYGGLIVENIVQAICRDLVAYGMLAVQEAGYDVIMHSHDELISEAPIGFGTVEEYERLMCSLPEWAEGFPVKAEGWAGKRYKK